MKRPHLPESKKYYDIHIKEKREIYEAAYM